MSDILDLYPLPTDSVVGREVDGEAVLVLTKEGQVKVLNEVGARIWSLIDGLLSVRDISVVIFQEYEVDLAQAEEDVIHFIEHMQELDIIYLSDNMKDTSA